MRCVCISQCLRFSTSFNSSLVDITDDTKVSSAEQSYITNTEELVLFISMAAVILVLLIAIIVIVTVIRRLRGQVKKWGDDEKALPRVSIRGMSELGHDGSINPAYRAENLEDSAALPGETNA